MMQFNTAKKHLKIKPKKELNFKRGEIMPTIIKKNMIVSLKKLKIQKRKLIIC